ncbi:MAG TPA: DUF2059 domain-containing protein [Gammaproteobacteria bacterium]|nr:DUF2059 domain-containing protein [Gammaproteobacteria bacterium]
MKRLILAAGLSTVTAMAWAGAPAPTTAPAAASAESPVISQQLHDDIMSMLQITMNPHLGDITKLMSTIYVGTLQAKYRNISPAVADEIRADIAKVVSDPARVKVLEESLVPVYAKVYTDDEVRQILAFAKTPVGAKMFSGNPTQQEINAALQPWAMGTITPAIMIDTAKILKEHNITINTDGSSSDDSNPAH